MSFTRLENVAPLSRLPVTGPDSGISPIFARNVDGSDGDFSVLDLWTAVAGSGYSLRSALISLLLIGTA
jgi:hypothetical protein